MKKHVSLLLFVGLFLVSAKEIKPMLAVAAGLAAYKLDQRVGFTSSVVGRFRGWLNRGTSTAAVADLEDVAGRGAGEDDAGEDDAGALINKALGEHEGLFGLDSEIELTHKVILTMKNPMKAFYLKIIKNTHCDEVKFNSYVREASERLMAMGMRDQIPVLMDQFERFYNIIAEKRSWEK